ncbi:MAG: hypothetical protein JST85_21345 [Acidobacteria bacterium]|nr:hypothetical protein [Acidobacteriota bacterium]
MRKKLKKDSMICPCCGEVREIAANECAACGARQIGEPMAKPDVLLPKLGISFAALGCSVLIVLTFLFVWILSNDMKVGRVLLIWGIGDATKLTQELLQNDPKLPYYRIFSYDAYRLAALLAYGLIPLSAFGIWLSRRAVKKASDVPAQYGGLSLARFSTVATTVLLVIFSSVLASYIPTMIERGRARKAAATRAKMYALHYEALQKYNREYGSYPQELTDLTRVNAEAVPHNDYWENDFSYQPVGVIASRGSAISFSEYKLVSAGPDEKFGTADDITMIDGIVVDTPPNSETATPTSVSESIPVKSRRR